jgi:hypothetical protein
MYMAARAGSDASTSANRVIMEYCLILNFGYWGDYLLGNSLPPET